MKTKRTWSDPFLYISVLLNIVIHHTWFFNTSILTFGDVSFTFSERLRQISSFQAWSFNGLGAIEVMPSAYPVSFSAGVLTRSGLSNAVIGRVIWFWPIVIVGSLGSYLLVKKISGSSLGGLVGSIIFNLNTFFIISSANHITIAAAIAWFALAFYLFLELVEKPSLGRALACAVPLFITSVCDFRVFYVCCFVLLLFYFFSLVAGRKKRGLFGYTALFFLPVAVVILLNAYWLVPYTVGGLEGGLQGVIVGRPLFIGGTLGTNLLHNAFALFEPMWSGGELVLFSVHPLPLYWFLPPLLAFSALLFKKLRLDWRVLFFSLVALIGIFLLKFYFPPFPGAYEWLYKHFPGFNAFREPSKFTFLIYLSYAVLIGCLIGYLQRRMSGKLWKMAAVFLLAALICVPFLINAVPLATGSAGALFIPRSLPGEYSILKDFIRDQPGFCRTLWVPTFSRWSYYDENHPMVSCVNAMSEDWMGMLDKDHEYAFDRENIMYILERPFSEELLKSSSIGYLIVPMQPADEDDNFYVNYGGDRQYFINRLDNLDYLERIDIGTEEAVVYRLKDYHPEIYATRNLCRLDPNGDLNMQYMLVSSMLGSKFPFTLSESAMDCIQVNDLLASGEEPGNTSTGPITMAIPPPGAGESLSLYADKSKGELVCGFENGKLVLRNIESGVLTKDGKPVTGASGEGDVLWEAKINPDYEYWLEANGVRIRLEQWKTTNLGEISRINSLKLYRIGKQNVIPNGSFEEGMWGDTVEDYSKDGSDGILGMELTDAEITQGTYSLQLEATRHIAGTHTVFPVEESQEYYFDFDYHSPNSADAGFDLEFRDKSGVLMAGAGIGERLSIPNEVWHHYRKVIVPPPGAATATLYIYSYDSDGQTRMITRYDNFELRPRDLIDDVDIGNIYNRFTEVKLGGSGGDYLFQFNPRESVMDNLIYNGSFEDGLWGDKVVDCSREDTDPVFGMELNDSEVSDGKYSLQLETARHIAGTNTVFPVEGNLDYTFSFDYQSPNSAVASYYLEFNNYDHTTISEVLPVSGTDWQHFQRRITTPLGATLAILYVYANPNFDEKTLMINRYDNFKFSRISAGPGLFYTVKIPAESANKTFDWEVTSPDPLERTISINSDMTPFILVLGQKYDPGWKLTIGGREVTSDLNGLMPLTEQEGEHRELVVQDHFQVDDCLNAWYVDPGALLGDGLGQASAEGQTTDIEFKLEFSPQRKARLGLVVSFLTLLACLILALGVTFRSGRAWIKKRRVDRVVS
jgi:Carbohydrate binding domain